MPSSASWSGEKWRRFERALSPRAARIGNWLVSDEGERGEEPRDWADRDKDTKTSNYE
jgi:hypothetical protein